jgi:DNA-binding HxlR family transcriptional regulator
MSEKSNRRWIDDPAIVARAVVLQILGEHREKRWSAAELERELSDLQPDALQEALLSLERAGVLERSGETVRASQAVRRLDELDLIAV